MGTRPKAYFQYFPASDRDKKWGFHITTAGECRIDPRESYPPPGHPTGYDFEWARGRILFDHQVVYISRGRGWFESSHGSRQEIEAGDVILLFPGVWHRYRPNLGTGWDEHWVGFNGEIPQRWVAEGFFSPANPVVRPLREEILLPIFTGMIEAIKSNLPALQQILTGSASQILGWLYSAQQARLTGGNQAMLSIQKAIGRMQNDLTAELCLPALARHLNVSYSWFRRTFARHTGSSPHQYLLELRLARARNLLSGTGITVKEAAKQSGFEDEHYFCRIFKERIGSTPSQWRSRALGGKFGLRTTQSG
jgi:AraC-like DNA-binding protein